MRSKMLAVAIAASLGVVSFAAAAQSATTAPAKPKHRTSAAAPAVSASELAALRDQIAALQAKVSSLEERENAQSEINVSTAQAVQATQAQAQATQTQVVQAAKQPVNFDNIRYKGVKITLGGFIEAASIYRSRNEGADMASSFSGIPFRNVPNGNTSEWRQSERQSRFSILAQGDVNENTHLAAYYEMDFLGAAQTANSNESNSFTPRTRNVYLTADWDNQGLHLLAGQNWSLLTLNSVGITPRTEVTPTGIDAQYVPGFSWARQSQIRLVKDWNKKYWLGLSIENPQTTFGGTSPSTSINQISGGSGFDSNNKVSINRMPDVIAKFAMDPGWGHYEVFGIGRSFYSSVYGGSNRNVYGGGFGVGMVLPLIPKELEFQFSGMSGRGLGRYGSAQLPDVTNNANGSIEPIKETMLLAGLTYHPTPDLDIYGYVGDEKEDKAASNSSAGKPYGYGNPLFNNAYCNVTDATLSSPALPACAGNTKEVYQGTVGFWWKFYQGKYGKMQFGAQYSYTQRLTFEGVGGAPSAKDNMVFTSFRYYPF